jgi:hypothetical protein
MRLVVAAVAAFLLAVPAAPALDPNPAGGDAPKDKMKMDEATKAAISKALKWLKDQQNANRS